MIDDAPRREAYAASKRASATHIACVSASPSLIHDARAAELLPAPPAAPSNADAFSAAARSDAVACRRWTYDANAPGSSRVRHLLESPTQKNNQTRTRPSSLSSHNASDIRRGEPDAVDKRWNGVI